MKKTLFTAIILLLSLGNMAAQSPAIQEFRQIVAARQSQFKNLQGDLLQDSPDKGLQIYASTIGESPISRSLITQHTVEGATYLINYNVEAMDAMKLRLFTMLVEQYMAELNAMVASGNYKGRDYESNGETITELTDMEDNLVAQYISSSTNHLLMVFGKS